MVRLGFLASATTPLGPDAVASFLAAVRVINNDPKKYLGNDLLEIEPHFFMSMDSAAPHAYPVHRDVLRLATPLECPRPTVALDAAEPPLDVHAIVAGGGTSNVEPLLASTAFMGKPLVAMAASGDHLSDKAVFPTFNRIIPPDRTQVHALTQISSTLGWDRVGVLYVSNGFGVSMRDEFQEACIAAGINVVSTVAIPAGLNLFTPSGATAATEVADNLREEFTANNVKVYLLATALSDLYTALKIVNQSTMFGSGFSILTPAATNSILGSPFFAPLYPVLHGSIGTAPYFDPESNAADEMWSEWPKNSSAWLDLLADAEEGRGANVTSQFSRDPTSVREDIVVWAHYYYDATMFTARAVANAWSPCVVPLTSHSRHQLDIDCLLEHIHNATINGTTGLVELDSNGDRAGVFHVVAISNGTDSFVGTVTVTPTNESIGEVITSINMDARRITWSDGVANRTSGPQWGQDSFAPTPAPVVENLVVHTASESENKAYVYIIVALVLVLLVVVGRMNFTKLKSEGTSWRTSDGELSDADSEEIVNVPLELRRSDVVVLCDVLGGGQFGNVNKALWSTYDGASSSKKNTEVAVKTVNNDANAKACISFLDEAVISWQFNHKNVVKESLRCACEPLRSQCANIALTLLSLSLHFLNADARSGEQQNASKFLSPLEGGGPIDVVSFVDTAPPRRDFLAAAALDTDAFVLPSSPRAGHKWLPTHDGA
eukprot:m.296339 g.296339  ORF g.296339 m.296339 type:complete len:720 (-) comp16273_c0_seq35:1032-3191(-)